jgi:pimeloyl-ACP methyl ester carboxylesterase
MSSRSDGVRSSTRSGASPAAQADAFAALLDALDIGQIDVVGLSAGATSALQLALQSNRHRPTVLDKASQQAIRDVGTQNDRPVNDGPPGGGGSERVRDLR